MWYRVEFRCCCCRRVSKENCRFGKLVFYYEEKFGRCRVSCLRVCKWSCFYILYLEIGNWVCLSLGESCDDGSWLCY